MGGLGAPELLIVLVVVLVLFGGAKLPQLARSLGQAQKEFRSGQEEKRAPDGELPEGDPGGAAPPEPPRA
ncbi:MAG: twin-arginine translocase TatA/TatE family subunit [Acidimicrobiales bacterium]